MTTKREDDDPAAKQKLIDDQREANAQMVSATMRAQDLTDEAVAGRERAEESEHGLRAVAEFREMFIGVVGHDLRNPLGSIVMSAGVLLERGRLDDSMEYSGWRTGAQIRSRRDGRSARGAGPDPDARAGARPPLR